MITAPRQSSDFSIDGSTCISLPVNLHLLNFLRKMESISLLIDGKTTDPSSFAGSVGSMIENDLTYHEIINYQRVGKAALKSDKRPLIRATIPHLHASFQSEKMFRRCQYHF